MKIRKQFLITYKPNILTRTSSASWELAVRAEKQKPSNFAGCAIDGGPEVRRVKLLCTECIVYHMVQYDLHNLEFVTRLMIINKEAPHHWHV